MIFIEIYNVSSIFTDKYYYFLEPGNEHYIKRKITILYYMGIKLFKTLIQFTMWGGGLVLKTFNKGEEQEY